MSNSMDGTTMHELQVVIDKVNKLCAAMRASGLEVKVTSHVNLQFEVRVDEPKKKRKAPPHLAYYAPDQYVGHLKKKKA